MPLAQVRGPGYEWPPLVELRMIKPTDQGYQGYLAWPKADGYFYDRDGQFELANDWQKITLGYHVDAWVAVWVNDTLVRYHDSDVVHDEPVLEDTPRFVVRLDSSGEIMARLPLVREPDWDVATAWKRHKFWWAADGGSSPAECDPTTDEDNDCDLPQRSATQLIDGTDDSKPAGIEAGNLTTLGDQGPTIADIPASTRAYHPDRPDQRHPLHHHPDRCRHVADPERYRAGDAGGHESFHLLTLDNTLRGRLVQYLGYGN